LLARAASVLVAAGLCACTPAEKSPAPAPRHSPARTLYQMKWAYNAPDFNAYRELFSAGEFELTFGETPEGFTGRWGYDEEMAATRAMFEDAYHVVLEMAATDDAVGRPAPAATSFTTEPLGVRVRVWREPTYCYYARGSVTFTLRKSGAGGRWVIVGMNDKTGAAHADVAAGEQTAPCSWADIKWYYLRAAEGSDAGD
jgi:hypothetical protein